jgi:biopolymer transport protein ExbB
MLSAFIEQRPALSTRHEIEDVAETVFLGARQRLQRHLWIVDTLVTAAPLLGLLGTILGIIDTFAALATSGISDPAAVSRGIGTALFATALGIAVALTGLLANNYFLDRVERIGDALKIVLLKAGQGPVGQDAESRRIAA